MPSINVVTTPTHGRLLLMATTADDRFYKRKLNEFDQELKRLQRELAKLKVLRRDGGRSRKQLLRSMHREMELQEVLDAEAAQAFADIQVKDKGCDEEGPRCKKCDSTKVNRLEAGTRIIIVCQDCESRYTIVHAIAETA